MDFLVTETLFYQLIKPDVDDKDWFDFSGSSVRWRDQSTRSAKKKVHTGVVSQLQNLRFPVKLSVVAQWYEWARSLIFCEMPDYLIQVLAAQKWEDARRILNQAHQAEGANLTKAVATLFVTPERSASAYSAAKAARDEARERERAVEACTDALQRALEATYMDELLSELKSGGLSNTVIDYNDFLQLTTFDGNEEHPHTGDDGFYRYRRNAEDEVIGIATGQAIQQFGAGEPRKIAAEHQRIADFRLPSTAALLVEWIWSQVGDVELAIPGSDEYPVEPLHWAEAVAKIAARAANVEKEYDQQLIQAVLAIPDLDTQCWQPVVCSSNAKALQKLVVAAVNGLKRLEDLASQAVIDWLLTSKPNEVTSKAAGGYEYNNGRAWVKLTTDAVAAQLRDIRKRVRASS